MAGKKKSELEVWEQLKDITECCVCSKTYKDPKMLPCIHTFCRTCLEEIGCKTSKSPGNQVPCPICRKEYTIPEEGYAALQTNFFMEKLIEVAQIASPSEGPDLCEACMEEESKSTSASDVCLPDICCADCRNKLCQKCNRYHTNNKLTRNHQALGGSDIKCKAQIVAPSNCMKHKMELDLYCSDCKKLLCKSCFGESHQSHRLQDIRNVVEGFKNDIKASLSSLEVQESKVLERLVILNCEVEKYCENLESLKLEVLAQADTTVKLVGEHANLVLQGIDQLKVQKQNEVYTETKDTDGFLTCLESFREYCAEVITKGSDSDICCAIDNIKARAEEITEQLESETQIKTHLHNMSFLMSDVEEFVKTEDYNIIGTIQECQMEAEGKDETKPTSDKISHDGDKKMEDDSRMPISSNNSIIAKIKHLKLELRNERRRICGLEMEKKTLAERINELELDIKRPMKSTFSGYQVAQPLAKQVPPARFSIDYKVSPNLVKTQPSLEGDRSLNEEKIFGLTVMDGELFVGCVIGHPVVEVYDTETFNFKRRWKVKSQSNMANVSCMASCARQKCLYACVIILHRFVGRPVIQRTDVNGSNAKELKINIKGATFVSNLSVTEEGNIIVINDVIFYNNSLLEYTRDGILIREVKLSCSLFIEHPLHALKLANGNFVVSHGRGKDLLHRVLLLSENGQITKSFGEIPTVDVCLSKVKQVPQVYELKLLNEPVCLTVDGFGNILVADCSNNRILVLNSNLEFNGVITTTQPLQKPSCMRFDSDRKQLFVCEDRKKISVYDFSDSVISFDLASQ